MNAVCRGVRGATTCPNNTKEAILAATRELLTRMVEANDIAVEDVASIFFTATTDLDATHPALAARQLGWVHTALLCAQEIDVPDGMPQVLRILIHWNTTTPLDEIRHVYIKGTEVLRPDLTTLTHNRES
jgi:chorismate mutase